MKNLIPIQENNGKKAVNARDLHIFLESKQQFADWIKNRINQYDFIENQDYVVFHNSMNNPGGGRPQIEYALSINMAKELSMVEGNEKGKQARRYFIACEEVATAKAVENKEPGTMNPNTLYNLRMKAIAWTAKMLNLSEESKLRMIKAVTEPLGLPSPDYATSKGVKHSATYLLKQRNNPLSVIQFNKAMLTGGFLEDKERPSKSKGTARFKCLTAKGLEFGENKVSPNNPLETQPHYYDDKFGELLEKLSINL